MRRELMEELEADTTLEDIAEPYRLVVEMIGLKNVLKLSQYFMGGQDIPAQGGAHPGPGAEPPDTAGVQRKERQGAGQGVRPDHQPDITDRAGPGPDTNQPV